MSKKKSKTINPIIRKNLTVGAEDADMDDFLETCFYDNDNVNTLLDTNNPQRIVIGRTGAGKTALLKELQNKAKNTIILQPENFSFRYLADSSVLNFFEAAGVNLHIFYLLLWRHVICIELIKKKYGINNEDKMKQFLSHVLAKLSGEKGKAIAIAYLKEWGEKFWITTEERIIQTTKKLEEQLQAQASVKIMEFLSLGAKGAEKLSEEQKIEVTNIGKDVVNKIQIEKLTQVINVLNDDIFNNPKDPYYILIDQLDENWAEDQLRYKIIRALIDTVKKFQKVRNTKIIIALREDLLLRVQRETRDSGTQEDKLEPLFFRLSWLPYELEEILNLRVKESFQRQYTNTEVTLNEILPTGQREQKSAAEYIISRTFLRPREVINFFNCCLRTSEGKTNISFNDISQAEMSYSRKRLRALSDEWVNDFPLLEQYAAILHGLPRTFDFSELLSHSSIDDILLEIACHHETKCSEDKICTITKPYIENKKQNKKGILAEIVCVFYQVGLIGVKLDTTFPIEWSYNSEPYMQTAQLQPDTRLYIHPTFWRALGISPRNS